MLATITHTLYFESALIIQLKILLNRCIFNLNKIIFLKIFSKTQRYDANENDYVLIEELREPQSDSNNSSTKRTFGKFFLLNFILESYFNY